MDFEALLGTLRKSLNEQREILDSVTSRIEEARDENALGSSILKAIEEMSPQEQIQNLLGKEKSKMDSLEKENEDIDQEISDLLKLRVAKKIKADNDFSTWILIKIKINDLKLKKAGNLRNLNDLNNVTKSYESVLESLDSSEDNTNMNIVLIEELIMDP